MQETSPRCPASKEGDYPICPMKNHTEMEITWELCFVEVIPWSYSENKFS
jgi:hypothetical protein